MDSNSTVRKASENMDPKSDPMDPETGKKTTAGRARENKKIALFISALRKGGSERVLVNLAEYLYAQGWQVTMVTQYQGEDEYVLSQGIRRVYSEITPEEAAKGRIGNFVRRFRKLRRIWKQEKPGCILSFIGKNNLMALFTAAFLKIPVVVSVRGEPKEEYYSRPLRFLARTFFASAAGVIVQTREALQWFPPRVRRKCVLLKNPLNPAFLKPRYAGEREKTIVAVGRLDANKNHEMLLRAFAMIASAFPDYRLVIYGQGECREKLLRLADDLSLRERVSLPGAVNDVAERIYRSSVFILTSYSEGMPNTLIEAMCLGLPAISTDCPCGGPAELIRDGVNGCLIPPGDTEALAVRLRALLSDPSLADQISRKAAELQTVYHPTQVAGNWETYLLTRLLPERTP